MNVFLSFVITGFLAVYVINKVNPEKTEILSNGVETIINFQNEISSLENDTVDTISPKDKEKDLKNDKEWKWIWIYKSLNWT